MESAYLDTTRKNTKDMIKHHPLCSLDQTYRYFKQGFRCASELKKLLLDLCNAIRFILTIPVTSDELQHGHSSSYPPKVYLSLPPS